MNLSLCQQEDLSVLKDVSSSGRENPWREKKMANELLSKAYDYIGYERKAERLRECATYLQFDSQTGKLHHMSSCRVRLCPLCTWRRSLKVFGQTKDIVDAIGEKYAYLMLTLTVKNCPGSDLSNTIDIMMNRWNLFVKYKAVKTVVKGFYRGFEVTHNTKTDEYHPHFHCLFAVNPGYFGKSYMKQEIWRDLWKKAMNLDYTPVVDIRCIKGNMAKAVAEVAKYAAKDSEYIIPHDWDMTADAVKTLDGALDKRRLVAYGGVFKEWHKKLNLDDVEDGDLVNVGSKSKDVDSGQYMSYFWHIGYRQYIRKD